MKLQKARKDHVCTECGEKIPKGSKYWRDYSGPDDLIVDRKEHISCPDIESKLTATAR